MTELEHKEDFEDLTAELKRREMAYKFMAQQVAQLVEEQTMLGAALNTATVLIDQLLSDLRLAGGTPTAGLIAAHDKFNQTMKQLLGHNNASPVSNRERSE